MTLHSLGLKSSDECYVRRVGGAEFGWKLPEESEEPWVDWKNICQIVMQPARQIFNHFSISEYTSVVLLTQCLVQKPQQASVFSLVILTVENMLHDNLIIIVIETSVLYVDYIWLAVQGCSNVTERKNGSVALMWDMRKCFSVFSCMPTVFLCSAEHHSNCWTNKSIELWHNSSLHLLSNMWQLVSLTSNMARLSQSCYTFYSV